MLDVFATPQQETSLARPRPVFRARSTLAPSGLGCAGLATLAFAPPPPEGARAEGRMAIYRKKFTPPFKKSLLCANYCPWVFGLIDRLNSSMSRISKLLGEKTCQIEVIHRIRLRKEVFMHPFRQLR